MATMTKKSGRPGIDESINQKFMTTEREISDTLIERDGEVRGRCSGCGRAEPRELAKDAVEHLLLVGADGGRKARGLLVVDVAREALDGRVRRDLQGLGRTRVLGVLEDLLLAAGAAHEIDRRLAERQRLADHGLGEADDGASGRRTDHCPRRPTHDTSSRKADRHTRDHRQRAAG